MWDSITDKKLDKDRFRKDLGDLIPAYTEVAKRLGILHEQSNLSAVNVTKLRSVKKMILRINDFMIGMFRGVGIKLIDFKLEFGRLKENGKNEVILADEISPDTCRLWDSITDKKLDKDRFRKDLGDLIPAYTEVAKRLGILHEQSNLSAVNVTKLRSIKKRK